MSSEKPTHSSPDDFNSPWADFDDLCDSFCSPLLVIPQAEESDELMGEPPSIDPETWEPARQENLNAQEYYKAFIHSSSYPERMKRGEMITKWEYWMGLRPELREEIQPELFDDVHHMWGFARMQEMTLNRARQAQHETKVIEEAELKNKARGKRKVGATEPPRRGTRNRRPGPGRPRKRGTARPRGNPGERESESGQTSQMKIEYF